MQVELPDNTRRDRFPPGVYLTCWPFGGVACGLATALIGVAILVAELVPDSPEIVWGVTLVVIGLVVAGWALLRGERPW